MQRGQSERKGSNIPNRIALASGVAIEIVQRRGVGGAKRSVIGLKRLKYVDSLWKAWLRGTKKSLNTV